MDLLLRPEASCLVLLFESADFLLVVPLFFLVVHFHVLHVFVIFFADPFYLIEQDLFIGLELLDSVSVPAIFSARFLVGGL